MKISVIMPTYNTQESFLREAIESILNQTYRDFEFIIINDGSTNNSEEVILSYKDERIKYIKQENQGLSRSLNNGLNIAKGEYIARMDSDDISFPERFKKQVEFLDNNPDISLLGTDIEIFPNTKSSKHISYPKFLDLLKGCQLAHPSAMFRRETFKKYNLIYNPEYLCEDYELWSRAVKNIKIANLQEVLLKYRIHGNNISLSNENFKNDVLRVRENMLEYLTNDEKMKKKIRKMLKIREQAGYTFYEKLFSIKNTYDKKYKIITILGIQIRIKSRKKFLE